ncbi:MAG: 50S ribosomal protein L4, partial [Granulosicoccaceae bacterium]
GKLGLENVLIVTEELSENLYYSVRNIPHVDAIDVQAVNPVNLMKYEKVLMTSGAVKKIEEQLS